MSWWKKINVAVVVLMGVVAAWLAGAYWIQERWRVITVGRETTFVSGPLREDGTVDYVGAINARCAVGVTPENNAAVVLLKATGTKGVMVTDRVGVWLERMGAKAPPEEGEYFVEFEEFMRGRVGKAKDQEEAGRQSEEWDEREEGRRRAVWRESDDAEVAAWITRSGAALKVAVEASRCERFYSPLVGKARLESVLEAYIGQMGACRGLSNALMARAMMRMGVGDVAGYREDLLATVRLGRLVMQGPTVIQRLVGVAMAGNAYRGVGAGLGRIGPGEMQNVLEELRGLESMPEMAEAADHAERYMYLDMVTQYARFGAGVAELWGEGGGAGLPERKGFGLCVIPARFDDVLRDYNAMYDREVKAASEPTYAGRKAALNELARSEDAARAGKGVRWYSPVRATTDILLGLPSLTKAYAIEDEARMRGRLAELGLLLEMYRARHGGYPETLAGLTKEEVRGADEDFFSGGKMVYRREGAGYLVYSVGINARDDGGKEKPRTRWYRSVPAMGPPTLSGGNKPASPISGMGAPTLAPGAKVPDAPDDIVLRVGGG